eukprot:scaffold6403_cov128-Skeletonema_dohrnii-CCMP3373.AAC.2
MWNYELVVVDDSECLAQFLMVVLSLAGLFCLVLGSHVFLTDKKEVWPKNKPAFPPPAQPPANIAW